MPPASSRDDRSGRAAIARCSRRSDRRRSAPYLAGENCEQPRVCSLSSQRAEAFCAAACWDGRGRSALAHAAARYDLDVTLLRDVEDGDLDMLFEYWMDPESNWMAAFTAVDPHDRDAFDERWRRLRESETITVRTIEADGVVVGSIGSWDNDGKREVTYWLGREHWGKGLATRALVDFLAEAERSRPLYAATADDNVASQRVLEKCGFRRVGGGRSFATARGAEIDEAFFRLDA
jgi:RimJ/RimL family protein N-acetyltransferase